MTGSVSSGPVSSGPVAPVRPATDPASGAVAFVRALRQAGIPVPVDSSVAYAAALDVVDLAAPDEVYWAGRATLVRRSIDVPVYDAVFAGWFGGVPLPVGPAPEIQHLTLAVDDPDADLDSGSDVADHNPELSLRFSRVEVLRHKDFAECDDAELAEAWRLIDLIRFRGAPRPSRRAVPAGEGGARPDLRRTVRAALKVGGEPIRRATTDPGVRLRRVVFLLDVSGSMEAYARALLRFVHAVTVARGRVEAFAVGTRLTRMTRELDRRDPDDALRRAAEVVTDFSGGTRLGDGLRRFNDDWGVRGMARGAIVVILSDGWDRGDPSELEEQMVRLQRVAHRVVWVNPLKATPGYAPLARGMAAALPHVDVFVEGHSVAALEELVAVVSGAAPGDGSGGGSGRGPGRGSGGVAAAGRP